MLGTLLSFQNGQLNRKKKIKKKIELPVLGFPLMKEFFGENKAHIERSQPISPSACNLTTQPCGLEHFRLQL